jgi:integrase
MGCRVKRSRHGTLALRVFWNGNESWEGTGLPDNRANWDRLERVATLIDAEIRAGVFDASRYLYYFPTGNRACDMQAMAGSRARIPTIAEYYRDFMERHQPPAIRQSLYRDRRNAFTRYILPKFGGFPLTTLKAEHLIAFREELSRTLKLKTARNIIDAIFRRLYREARLARPPLVEHDPFAVLEWPRLPHGRPDPFSEEERDCLLEHFREGKLREYPFLAMLFLTGMRPGEVTALRVGDVDMRRCSIDIARSRHLGHESAPKTEASNRTIRIPEGLARILSEGMHPDAEKDDYLFTSRAGTPVDQSEWPKTHLYPALEALKIRRRKFYATRATYISLALTYGANIKHVAEHCGTSVTMIEKHYGRYLRSEPFDPLTSAVMRARIARSETVSPRAKRRRSKRPQLPYLRGTSPTGFEPVLPA